MVWFSNTSCGSQRHLSVPSFLLRSKTADLEDLPPAAPPAAGLADLPCVLSRYTDIPGELLLYLLFLLCPNRPRGPGGCPPALPRLVAAWRSSWLRAPRRPLVPRCSALLPPSLSAQPLDLSPLPPGNTCGAPPRARFVYRHRQSFSFLSSSRWRKSRLGNSRVEPKRIDLEKGEFVGLMIYIYIRRQQQKKQCGLSSPGRSQKQAQNRRMTRPCLSKKSAPLSTGAGFVPAVGP